MLCTCLQLKQAFPGQPQATPVSELGKLTADLYLSLSNHATVDLKNGHAAESQDKDFKISIMNMFKNLRENMKKSINESTNKQTNEMKKTVQDVKNRNKIIKNKQTEENLEMKNLGVPTGTSKTSLTNRIQETVSLGH